MIFKVMSFVRTISAVLSGYLLSAGLTQAQVDNFVVTNKEVLASVAIYAITQAWSLKNAEKRAKIW
jgi:hypothetical protein